MQRLTRNRVIGNMLSVDRIEEDFAVVVDENGSVRDIPADMISGSFREGDILVFDGGTYHADKHAAEERRK